MSLERVPSGEPPRFLLLLPPAPTPPTVSALKAAYGETIRDVLKEVATHSSESSKAAVLEIALACPHLVGARGKPRSSLYDATQAILSGIYKLIITTAAHDDVNIEDADGVDPRIILVAWSPEGGSTERARTPYGPIVDMETLATSGRQWQFAFGVESDAGGSMVRAFVAAKGSSHEVSRVEGELARDPSVSSVEQPATATETAASVEMRQSKQSKHYDVAVGGTWDHLHIGHKLLIAMTIFAVDEPAEEDQTRTATIGITGDQMLTKKKHANFVEGWAERQKAVATYFNALIDFSQPAAPGHRHVSICDDPVPNGKSLDVHYSNGLVVKCTEIQDPFGPTITEERISALIISAETRSGGTAVNDKRKGLGWKELDVFEVDVLDAEEAGQEGGGKDSFDSKISSTAIREKLARKSADRM